MTLVSLILVLAIVGFVAYLVTLIPMPEVIRKVIIGVIILFVVVWVLQNFGFVDTNLRLR